MLYLISKYNYENKKAEIIYQNNNLKNTCEAIEAYMQDYIKYVSGHDDKNNFINIKNYGETLTSKEWNNNIRYYICKSKNYNKYIIKKMVKKRGYFYNLYKVINICAFEITSFKSPNHIKYDNKENELFENHEKYNLVVDELCQVLKIS